MILSILVWIVSFSSSPSSCCCCFPLPLLLLPVLLLCFLFNQTINQLVLYSTKSQPKSFHSALYNQRKTKWAHRGTPLDHILHILLCLDFNSSLRMGPRVATMPLILVLMSHLKINNNWCKSLFVSLKCIRPEYFSC